MTQYILVSLANWIDSHKNETVWYGIGTNEMAQYFNGTANGTLVHYSFINFVVYSYV